jgi:acyl-CoA synthetase (AMP-forming)/AMP-acid ligase II
VRVPQTVNDFLYRAEAACADATAVVDEPAQPAVPVTITSYGQLLGRVRAWQAGFDALGVGQGERVAVVSHNAARLLELMYAIPSSGRICVPVTFRLRSEEVDYIIQHCGASALLVDPEIDEPLKAVHAPHRFVLGGETDENVMRFDTEPRVWTEPDEDATATITTPRARQPDPRVCRSRTAASGSMR